MVDQVLELLRTKNIYFKVSGQDYLIKCLNPEHEDSNPSMRVDKTDGKFHCFSCGFKGSIFKYFGIFTNQTSLRVLKLKEKLRALEIKPDGIELPEGHTPFRNKFRGISVETLKHFGAFYTTAVKELEDRICFPINDITGKTLVYVARHTLSDGNPRYINYPRGVSMPLFPPYVTNTKSVVLVEGLFDFLNCYDKGLTNVVCTFGTNTVHGSAREKLQPFKTQGITKVYIMFDGDKAGSDAAIKLKPLIEELDLQVEIIKLEDDIDPGQLSQEYIDSIREYVNGKDSSN